MALRDRLLGLLAVLAVLGCATVASPTDAEVKVALAPNGAVRVGFVSTSIYVTRDPASGALRGIAIDLGNDLARRLAVPLEPRSYSNVTALLAGVQGGEVDVALMGVNAERVKVLDFSAPYMEVELGYLVRPGTSIANASEIDRPGVRVGVLEKGGSDLSLSKSLKAAQLVRSSSGAELYDWLRAGKVDAVAATKTALYVEADKLAGSRVLDGRFLVEPIAAGVPKGRSAAAAAFIADFVEAEKSSGQVKAAIDRAGLRGVAVAPPK